MGELTRILMVVLLILLLHRLNSVNVKVKHAFDEFLFVSHVEPGHVQNDQSLVTSLPYFVPDHDIETEVRILPPYKLFDCTCIL